MKGYKAFGKGLVCKGKQYAENTVFEESKAEICKSGMHFCENPFDTLDYYPIINNNGEFNEFAPVEALDEVHTDDNKKFCTKKLKIGAKFTFAGFINAAVDFLTESTMFERSSGNDAQIGSSRIFAKIGSSGDFVQIGSSGSDAQIGSSGDFAKIGSSGNYVQIGSSGDCVQIGSLGNFAKIGLSGNDAQIGSSGDFAKIGSSGNRNVINSTGENSVICCAGHGCKAKAKKGSWITLSEWKYLDKKECYVPKCVKTEYVDGEKIKADTWYKLENGAFVEVGENE